MIVEEATQVLWRYLRRGIPPQPADILFVLGNEDLDCATLAAALYHEGLAPRIVMSGATGRSTHGVFRKSEAELFAEEAVARGVPAEAIILETLATNTGENVRRTRELLAGRKLEVKRVLAVQKPYAERRVLVSLTHYWPDVETSVISRNVSFDDYCARGFDPDELRAMLAGEVHRMLVYPVRGWQAPEPVPAEAVDAMRVLAAAGFERHMIRGEPV